MKVEPSPEYYRKLGYRMKPRGIGTITKRSENLSGEACWLVHWSGVKSPETLHHKFLQRVNRAQDG